MGRREEYTVPGLSRIKLKDTPNEQAEKIYRAEQLRQSRMAERVSRANGETGPRPTHIRFPSPSPYHLPSRHRQDTYPEDVPNFYTDYASQWDARNSTEDDIRIPSRYASGPIFGARVDRHFGDTFASTSAQGPRRNRRAEDEVQLEGGHIPSMGDMSSSQYKAWIREGMDTLRRKDDAWLREDQAREKQKLQRERDAAIQQEQWDRERQQRRAQRKFERAETERKAAEAEMRAQQNERAAKKRRTEMEEEKEDTGRERRRYISRWKTLGGSGEGGADVIEVELAFGDIPWPVYRIKGGYGGIDVDMLSNERVGAFLRDLARDSGASERKVQMEAIRQFHPDRFFGRILPRVKERDAAAVKQGVEKCSRVINSLMANRNA